MIPIVIGILGLFVPIILYLVGRDSKEISVQTISRAVVADLSDPALGDFKLTYKDRTVSRLTIATIEVRNSGTRSIEARDFERPVLLQFPGTNPVIAAAVGEKNPPELTPVIEVTGNGVNIAPLLLNPGDFFRLSVSTQGDFAEPNIGARISGIRRVSRGDQPWSRKPPLSFQIFVLVGTGYLLTAIFFYASFFLLSIFRYLPPQRPPSTDMAIMISGGFLAVGVVLALTSLLLELTLAQESLLTSAVAVLASPAFFVAAKRALHMD